MQPGWRVGLWHWVVKRNATSRFMISRQRFRGVLNMVISKRIVRDFVVFGFAIYGVLWAIVESFGYFFEDNKPEGVYWYGAMVIVSVVSGLWKCWPRNRIVLKIPASDSSMEITFGDIFEGDGVVVIPVNEYFDGCLGDRVSENTLHGLFIKNILGGQSTAFFDLTSRALESFDEEHMQSKSGREMKYPIGTVACVDVNEKRFLLAALSRTNIKTQKASATVHELWDCLAGTWDGARNFSNGDCVKLPLVGSGQSGVGLPAKNLVEIIVTSFLYYTKKQKIADRVILVLHSRLRGEIDLVSIRRSWT